MNSAHGVKLTTVVASCKLSALQGVSAVACLASLGAVTQAQAQATPMPQPQTAPTPLPAQSEAREIVVTGTQIRGVAPVGAPVVSVNRAEIEASGLTTTADILHDIPQVTFLGANSSTIGANQNASLNTNKDNGINIRGLGPQATLTLIDGRRAPLGGASGNVYDPSAIPSIALAGIEVVADGASATYGSDAVAGVANLVLRKNFEGLELQADYGGASSYNTHKFAAIFGHKWNGGSVMIAAEENFSSLLIGAQRPQLFGCTTAPSAHFATPTCVPYGVPNGNVVIPKNAGIAAGTYGVPAGGAASTAALGPENFFNPGNDVTLLPRTNRHSVVLSAHQDLSDKITLWTEGFFTKNDISYINGELQASGNLTAANPAFIPPGGTASSETAEIGLDALGHPALRTGFEREYQIAVGASIVLPHRWEFDLSGEHNYNYSYTITPGINTGTGFAPNTTTPNTGGEAASFACTVPGVPCFNPFGTAAQNQAAFSSFIGAQYFNYWQTENIANGKLDGPLVTLPGGDVKIAVGFELQHNTLRVDSQNTITVSAADQPLPLYTAAAFSTTRNVYSFFGEAIIPLVGSANNLPFVKELVVDVAGRYDHYSDVGATTNPKVSLRWKPVSDLSIHADYGTSFRAPTLCDTNPNCSGGTMQGRSGQGGYTENVIFVIGGNSAVKPETATTWSVGADYKPSWASGLSLSLNYFNIDYKNVIETPGQGLAQSNFTNPLFASLVNQTPTQAQINALTANSFVTSQPFPTTSCVGVVGPCPGVGAIVQATRQNSGVVLMDGVDIGANYHFANSLGQFSAGINGTYVFGYKFAVLAGLPITDVVNQVTAAGNFPVHFHSRAKFSWSLGGLTTTAYVNYTGGYSIIGAAYAAQNDKVSAYTTVDATILYKLPDTRVLGGLGNKMTLSLSAINLFDEKPPYAQVASTTLFDSQQASALGREIIFSIKKAF